ncbi:hypothetical protein AK812_SmicGene41750 [Symbiodinium microadriaticum]|uniref:Uncharacterized protein n=1 Tax=Symbiodinium microadriaticum TaxID=2951 RepID=A0A1Q9C5B2_SYMMI|nr:hypothetical protein AK812_SmicGene41750 [Symbiodinium microadriaticum]
MTCRRSGTLRREAGQFVLRLDAATAVHSRRSVFAFFSFLPSLGLDPARYDPKFPKAYDHGLPKKHIPFTSGSTRFDHRGRKDYRPGPGDYNAAKQTLAGALTVSAAKTMGVAPAEQRLLFKSTRSVDSHEKNDDDNGGDENDDGDDDADDANADDDGDDDDDGRHIDDVHGDGGEVHAGDGRLLRQGRKDGIRELSGPWPRW